MLACIIYVHIVLKISLLSKLIFTKNSLSTADTWINRILLYTDSKVIFIISCSRVNIVKKYCECFHLTTQQNNLK